MSKPHTAPNTVQIRLIFTTPGRGANIVLHALKSGAVSVDQGLANSVGAQIKSEFTSSGMAGSVSTLIALANVGLRDIASANNAEFLDTGAAVPGTGSADLLSSRTALCVTHRTARAGKSFRGRSFAFGFTEISNDTNGHCVAGTAAAAAAFFNTIRTGLVSSNLQLGVCSADQYDDAGALVKPGFTTPITLSLSRNNNWESQRKRNW